MKRIFINLISLLLPLVIFSQSEDYVINVHHFTKDDGLKSNYIAALYKDSQGLVWVGAAEGLNRFDGRNFKWFDDKTAIGGSAVISIVEDKFGNLWVLATDKGDFELYLIDLKTDEIKSFEEYYPSDNQDKYVFTRLYINKNKDIYLISKDLELYTFEPENGLKKVYSFNEDLLEIPYIDKEGKIWFTEIEGNPYQVTVNVIDTNGVAKKLYTFKHKALFSFLHVDEANDKIYYYWDDPLEGCTVYEIGENSPTRVFFRKEMNMEEGKITYNSKDELFVAINMSEMLVMNKNGETVFAEKKENGDYPIRSQIDKSFFDEQGDLWLRSFSGFYHIELKPNKFKRLLYVKSNYINQSTYRSCRGILQDSQERLFMNNYKGGMLLDKGEIKPYPDNFGFSFPISIIEDRKKNIWLGCINYLSKLEPDGRVRNYDFRQRKKGEIWAIYEGDSGHIWLGCSGDISVFDPSTEELTIFTKYNEFQSYFGFNSRNYIYQFFKDKNQTLWICTSKGLFVLDEEKGLIARYGEDADETYYLPQSDFRYIYEDAAGIYWLAHNEGMIRWDKKNATYKDYTSYNSRHFSDVHSIYEDDFNNLWIATNDGLLKFDKTTEEIISYREKDGITSDELNKVSSFQAANGTIYFGSINGVTAFHPRDFTEPEDSSHINIPFTVTEFEQYSGDLETIVNKKGEVLKSGVITIHPDDKFFKIGFSLTDYTNNKGISYRYLIEGIDEEWQEIKENHLRISGLPYGKARLRIQAIFPDGVQAKQEIDFPIRVIRPFYQQWWFFLLGVLTIIGIFRWRIEALRRQKMMLENVVKARTQQIELDKNTIEHQAEELRKLDKMKSKFFANASHELRTPLTLILGPISTLSKDKTLSTAQQRLLQLTRKNAQQLLRLVNEILDLSKLEAGKLELYTQPTYFYPLIHRLVTTFESYAEKQGIVYKLDYRLPTDLQLDIDIKKLEKIINNLLSNAFKYTEEDGDITVKVTEDQHQIQIAVSDTGRGIHDSDLPKIFDRYYQSKYTDTIAEGGTGIGLALSSEYAKLLEGKLWAESVLGEGSTFYFQFPKIEVFKSTSDKVVEWIEEHPIGTTVITSPKDEQITFQTLSNQSLSILLVEDNPDLRIYLQRLLANHFTIYTAENGKKALQQLQQLQDKGGETMLPDLVISDVMMPIMDGFQFVSSMRTSTTYKRIPVIMLTARVELTDKLRALRIGVDDYLLKPFEEEELFARINNLIKNSKERLTYQQTEEKVVRETIKNTTTVTATRTQWTDKDIEWLENLEKVALENIGDASLTLEGLAYKLAVSRTKLFRRVKQLTGLTPNQYLQEVRLKKALDLLEGQHYNTVKEVTYAIGWKQPRYFARKFRERFGRTPSSYLS